MSNPPTPGPEPPFHHFFICLRCDGQPEFEPTAFLSHLADVHQQPQPIRGHKHTMMHMDGGNWFQSDYQWIVNHEPICIESIRIARPGLSH